MISVEELTRIFREEVLENQNFKFTLQNKQIFCVSNNENNRFFVKHDMCRYIDVLQSYYIDHSRIHKNLDNFPKRVMCETLDFANNELTCIKNFPIIIKRIKFLVFSDCHFLEDYSPLSKIDVIVDKLRLNNSLFSNFAHLPSNVEVLNVEKCYRLRSFEGIEKINRLRLLIVYDLLKCTNILNLLQCTHLRAIHGADVIGSQFGPIKKYIGLRNKQDYIMDCAIDLIDAGFEC